MSNKKLFILFLRGINVGGHNKVIMAELREILTKAGLMNVKTYIQSGNVVFETLEQNKSKLENKIFKEIYSHFGFEVQILLKTKAELEIILNNCPFNQDKKESSYFIMFKEVPKKELIAEISNQSFPNEEFIITENCIYIFYALGAGKAKLGVNWFENKLNVKATARNYRTMLKLLSLSDI